MRIQTIQMRAYNIFVTLQEELEVLFHLLLSTKHLYTVYGLKSSSDTSFRSTIIILKVCGEYTAPFYRPTFQEYYF